MLDKILSFCGEYKVANIKNTIGHEGPGFQCYVLKGGKVLGTANDYGDGGRIHWSFQNPDDLDELVTFAKAQNPEMKFEVAEVFIGTLVDYFETIKKMKSKTKKAIVCYETNTDDVDERGVAQVYSQFTAVAPTAENIARVNAKYPHLTIVNDELAGFELPKVKAKR